MRPNRGSTNTQSLVFGVTTALDMFNPVPEFVRQVKREHGGGHGSHDQADARCSRSRRASATSEPARQFRLTDRGRIARGLRADLLLVRGDPTTDITATRDIVAVWTGGVAFDRQAYRAGLRPGGNRE